MEPNIYMLSSIIKDMIFSKLNAGLTIRKHGDFFLSNFS